VSDIWVLIGAWGQNSVWIYIAILYDINVPQYFGLCNIILIYCNVIKMKCETIDNENSK